MMQPTTLPKRRALALYGLLMRAYPDRFRTRYGDAMREVFTHELVRVESIGSTRLLVSFLLFSLADLAVSIAMTQAWHIWRRLRFGVRIVSGSTVFVAAAATLGVMAFWAWSRFASDATGDPRRTALAFGVATVHAAMLCPLARIIGFARRRRGPRAALVRRVTVQRARIVASAAKVSAASLAAATLLEIRRAGVRTVFAGPVVSPAYWLFLSATLAALLATYFVLGSLLRVRAPR